MIEFIGILYLVIGFIIGICTVVSNFDRKDYIWNKEKGVEFWAVVLDLPGWLLFIGFMSIAWGAIVIVLLLDWIGLLPQPCIRD